MLKPWFLLLALFVGMATAYSDYSFETSVNVNPDGTAHVTEKTIFLFENNEERQEFENKLSLGESTIIEWQKFSKNIKFHFRGGISDTRITAKKEFSVSFSAGAVIVEYDVETPLFNQRPEGSRRTIYSLNEKRMAFDVTRTGETILGNNMKLAFEIPVDAELLSVAPPPDAKEANKLVWNGPIARAWELEFAREIPLSQEVNQFFGDALKRMEDVFPLLLLAGFILIVGFILLKFRSK